MIQRKLARLVCALAAVTFAGHVRAADEINIATGNAEGLYYAAGQAICRALAAHPQTASVPCRAVATSGSISNILELNPKSVQFAIVQADAQYNAVAGLGLFAATGPDQDLRSVFSIHSEALSVVVPAGSKAQTFNDLRGARFSAGQTGTGTRETAEALFEVLNWTKEDRANVVDMPLSAQSAALCAGKLDAAAFLTGHPSPLVTAIASACPVRLLTVPREASEQLAANLVYYRAAAIPGNTYPGNAQPVETVGLRTAVVTGGDVPARLVRAVTEAVFNNLTVLRDAAPAFGSLRPDEMSTAGLIAPVHPGALEYYKAAGLPTPSVQITPSDKSPIAGSADTGFGKLTIDPK